MYKRQVEYFDRLLEQIREIRLSERRFYQKITDIYATALDYDRTAKTTKQFFAKVQNKMHYAVHGHTAAKLIYERADADKPHMGLTTWAAAPEGKIVKSDVSVAKNYLSEQEMRSLERIVSAYLDLAEDRAEPVSYTHLFGDREIQELCWDNESTVETVCLLSKLHEAKHHVNVRLDMDEMDLTAAERR